MALFSSNRPKCQQDLEERGRKQLQNHILIMSGLTETTKPMVCDISLCCVVNVIVFMVNWF